METGARRVSSNKTGSPMSELPKEPPAREITPESRADLLEVEDEVRRVLKKYFSRSRGKRPLIVPHIFEM